ncbi:MAG: sensor histidine kinase, partial [Thermoplasmatota archaeon]
TAEDDSDDLKIIFEDDGEGIPKDVKELVFDKNYKGSKSKGSGLGLFLVKRIVDTYGGEITVKDSHMGGARFDIRLNGC